MKVLIKNMATYARQVQYFRKNQYVVLQPRETLEILDEHDQVALAYYESLTSAGFSVCFHHDEDNSCADTDVKIQHSEEEGCKCSRDLSGYSDEQLKRICKNLGVGDRVRARWRLESLIIENLPEDANIENYLL